MSAILVKRETFTRIFAELFGRAPEDAEWVEWCVAWGGTVDGDRCVFPVQGVA